jgi:hypothetical protein
MNFNARMSGALVALSLLWQGCLVIPVKETKAAEGQKPPPAGFDHWRVGETSREEVLKELGSPYLQFDDLRVVAYSWRMIVGYMPWFFAAGSQGAGGIEKLTRGYVLLVAFDERDRLAAREVLHHEGWTTIRKTSEAWLHKRGLAHSPVADSPGTHSIHPGQCVFYVIRSRVIFDNPYPVQVFWDGRRIAELAKGDFCRMEVEPGDHLLQAELPNMKLSDSLPCTVNSNDTCFVHARIPLAERGHIKFRVLAPAEGETLIQKSKSFH